MVKHLLAIGALGTLLLAGCGTDTTGPDTAGATISFSKISMSDALLPELLNSIQNMHVEARRDGNMIASRDVPFTQHTARLTVSPGSVLIRLVADNGSMLSLAQAETLITVVPGINQLPELRLESQLKQVEPATLRVRVWIPNAWIDDTPALLQVYASYKNGMPETRVAVETEAFSGGMDTFSLHQSLAQRFTANFLKPVTVRIVGDTTALTTEFISNPVVRPTHNLLYSIVRDGKRTNVIFSAPESDWSDNTSNVMNELQGIYKLVYFNK